MTSTSTRSTDTATEIPDRPEAITAEWLSTAVQHVAPDARAMEIEVVDAHSGTTGRAQLRVVWEGGNLPNFIFAKLAPTDPIQRAMAVSTGMGAREARFYRELAEEVPVRVPRGHLAAPEPCQESRVPAGVGAGPPAGRRGLHGSGGAIRRPPMAPSRARPYNSGADLGLVAPGHFGPDPADSRAGTHGRWAWKRRASRASTRF